MTAPASLHYRHGFSGRALALGSTPCTLVRYLWDVGLHCCYPGDVCISRAQPRRSGTAKRGLNPYDERTYYITGKAAYAAYNTFIIVSGLFVLGGSIFGPQVLVNPYNTIGFAMAVLVLLHLGFYYYYNSKE